MVLLAEKKRTGSHSGEEKKGAKATAKGGEKRPKLSCGRWEEGIHLDCGWPKWSWRFPGKRREVWGGWGNILNVPHELEGERTGET